MASIQDQDQAQAQKTKSTFYLDDDKQTAENKILPWSNNNRILRMTLVTRSQPGDTSVAVIETEKGNRLIGLQTLEDIVFTVMGFLACQREYTAAGAPLDATWSMFVQNRSEVMSMDRYHRLFDILGNTEIPSQLITNFIENIDGKRETIKAKTAMPATLGKQPFPYQALPFGAFRLVFLLPSPNHFADIEVILFHDLLQTQPHYEALSYVWGDASNLLPIKVNGQVFRVTENLESALRFLRNRSKVRTLWIDAICIDQGNIAERNSQLRQMPKIYSNAKEVAIWLGKQSNSAFIAFSFLKAFRKAFRNKNWHSDLQDVLAVPELSHAGSGWISMTKLFARPWWERVWVMQEVVLAAKATVYCGMLSLDWEVITDFLRLFAGNHLFVEALFDVKTAYTVKEVINFLYANSTRRAMNLAEMRELWRNKVEDRFLTVVLNSLERKATDERDHIYGILGLLEDDERNIIPNYNLDVKTVFTLMTILHIERSGTLDMLSLVRHCSIDELSRDCSPYHFLPSWVLDFRVSGGPEALPLIMEPTETSNLFLAAGDRKSPFPYHFSKDNRLMRVRGFRVDTVEYTGITVMHRDPSETTVKWKSYVTKTILKWKSDVIASFGNLYQGNESMEEAFWRTVLTDCGISSQKQSRLGMEIIGVSNIPPRNGAEETLLLSAIYLGRFVLGGRRFIRTQRGWFGLGSRKTRVGDVVVVLLGGSTPFILRPGCANSYFFLCESYIHGIMDGEIAKEWKAGKRESSEFLIL